MLSLGAGQVKISAGAMLSVLVKLVGLPAEWLGTAPTPEQIAAAAKASRAAAYAKEADPLFFQAQRGEATMEEWKAKVAEIRARYPDGVLPAQ